MTIAAPRIGVITFPGSLDDRDAMRAVETMGGEGVALWHADPRSARRRRRDPARRIQLRRLPALWRDRWARADPRRGARVRRPRGAGARHLQRVPDPVRGGAAARRPDPQRVAAVHLPRCVPAGRDLADARHGRARARARWWRSRSSTARGNTSPRPNSFVASRTEGSWCSATPTRRGDVTDAANPNGSLDNIAGVRNEAGNVVGLMPHPEHAVDPDRRPDRRASRCSRRCSRSCSAGASGE